ncbi:unnamed protein product [Vitrella brassicaformis CCMP3155]|uniref:RecA family profile 1 domain-containing protein n=1 Tax=Vitrella brassicaformis (strain CCMP3155) TaxID=1169540 RepID=A0A0G4FR77_VITBC|nr:unnamed protein product [Vitrella brassicaformis CCMP3155]|eukprot:CEM16741.1 unnamed protein product [Vitrella brassicaformis CCMP3155]
MVSQRDLSSAPFPSLRADRTDEISATIARIRMWTPRPPGVHSRPHQANTAPPPAGARTRLPSSSSSNPPPDQIRTFKTIISQHPGSISVKTLRHSPPIHTCQELIHFCHGNPLVLMYTLEIDYAVATALVDQCFAAITPAPSRLGDLWLDARSLPTGLPTIDRGLQGGLAAGQVFEFAGPAGVGKTQVCFSLAQSALMQQETGGGGGGSVMWIDTEGAFSPERLGEVLMSRVDGGATMSADRGDDDDMDMDPIEHPAVREALGRVHVMECHSLTDIDKDLAPLLANDTPTVPPHTASSSSGKTNWKLVIVDSVTAAAKRTMTTTTTTAPQQSAPVSAMGARQMQLNSLAEKLKVIANKHGIPVVVTNQVAGRGGWDEAGDAALGPLWHHAVNCRFLLTYSVEQRPGDDDEQQKEGQDGDQSQPMLVGGAGVGRAGVSSVKLTAQLPAWQLEMGERELIVQKSPVCGPVRVKYTIHSGGVAEVRE